MYHIRKIVNQASPLLCGGLLAMEIGVGQAEKVIEMMNDSLRHKDPKRLFLNKKICICL